MHVPFFILHTFSLEMQQPCVASSQLPWMTLLDSSQSAGREQEPAAASHWDVLDMRIGQPGGAGRRDKSALAGRGIGMITHACVRNIRKYDVKRTNEHAN